MCFYTTTKHPNLKLKLGSNFFLGSLPLSFLLPELPWLALATIVKKKQGFIVIDTRNGISSGMVWVRV